MAAEVARSAAARRRIVGETRWINLNLRADGVLTYAPVTGSETVGFDMSSGRAGFTWEIPEETEISGPMALRLFLETERAEDLYLFVAVQKLRAGRVVPFEGSYGYGFDRVTTGWLRIPVIPRYDSAQNTLS